MRIIEQQELNEIVENHKLWLETRFTSEVKGARADLSYANLRGANLHGADLSYADLHGANLHGADLRGAENIGCQQADFRERDLDFCTIPLSCRGLKWKIDRKIAAQLVYHLCSHECEDEEVKKLQNLLIPFANTFHRVDECGNLEEKK